MIAKMITASVKSPSAPKTVAATRISTIGLANWRASRARAPVG